MSGTLSPAAKWFDDSLVNRHASVETLLQCPVSNSRQARPFGHCASDAASSGQKSVGAFVIALRSLCGPSAVVVAVSEIVVDAIKRMSVWTLSHVGQKLSKRLPRWINRDAAIDVSASRCLFGIVTACFHSRPRTVGARLSESVPSGSFSASLIVEASTTASDSLAQTVTDDNRAISTRTLAQPVSTFTLGSAGNWLRGTFNHLQPSEYLAGQVDRS